ncbi:putative calmodulin [Ramicandelaber brevisporus]|nr:putative calmodulin [Ramicandelaber brevisporus]
MSDKQQQQQKQSTAKLSEEQLKSFRSAFDMFDQDRNGKLCSSELGQVLLAIGFHPTEQELKDLVNDLDTDYNGTIDFDEFVTLMTTRGSTEKTEEQELRDIFDMFDKDKNGTIDAQEMVELMAAIQDPVTIEQAKELIAAADDNGDGVISFEEWKKLMQKGA